MDEFQTEVERFYELIGKRRKMVLSTSLHDKVTSRMMSVVLTDGIFYFQTDNTFPKYQQLTGNPNVALCIDNIQIQGECTEIGHPLENHVFCLAYKELFYNSYQAYSSLKNERLFLVKPTYVEMWVYENKIPFVVTIDFISKAYCKTQYIGE